MRASGRSEGRRASARPAPRSAARPAALWNDPTGGQRSARNAAAKCLGELPDESRLVLALLCLEGLTEAEAAAALGTTERHVHRLAADARRHMRAAIAGLVPDA